MNMISITDLFDSKLIFQVKDHLVQMCQKYGEIQALEIPCPNGEQYSYGTGKLFVKFENV